MSKVQGGELMLFLNGKSIAFATNHELNIDTDTSDFSCKDEGDCGWSNEEIDMLNWSVTSDNVFALNGEGNTYEDLFDLMLERTPIDAVFNKKSEDGCNVPTGGWTSSTEKPYKGKVIITDLSLTAQHGEYATFSATFMGYGELVDTSKIKYLWFEPLDKAARFKFTKNQPNDVDIEYSLDGENWTYLPSGEASPLIEVGDKIYWRGELGVQTFHYSDDEILLENCGIGTFAVTEFSIGESPAKFKVGGDLNSLLTHDFYKLHDLTPYQYAFFNLFKSSSVFDITEMIFRNIKLSHYCYGQMFNGCLSLTNMIDELPAMQLATHCYYAMFNNCTSITKAPELPATELEDFCYHWMFRYCLSLTESPRLVAPNINKRSCYLRMFENCRNLNKIYLDAINVDSELIYHTNNNPLIDWMNNVAVCGVLVIKPYNTWYNTYDLQTYMYIPENWVVTTNENSVDNYEIKLFDKSNKELQEIWFIGDQTVDYDSERANSPISIKGYKYDSQLFKGNIKVQGVRWQYSSKVNPDYHQGGVVSLEWWTIEDGEPYTQSITSATFDLSKQGTDPRDDGMYVIIQDENNKPLAYKMYHVTHIPL